MAGFPSRHPSSKFLFAVIAAVFAATTVLLAAKNQSLSAKHKALEQETAKIHAQSKQLEEAATRLSEKFDKAEKERKNLKDALEALKKENESLQFDLKKNETRIHAVSEEKTYLEDILIHKTKEIEGLRSSSPDGGADTSPAEQLREKDSQIRRLSEQNKTLSLKLEKLYKTMNDRIAEINVAKIALEETVAEARRKIEDEWNTVDLGSISVGQTDGSPKKTETRKTPKKDGKVLAVNADHGFVVVDLGRVDNLKSDTVLDISQSGKIIGTLSVLEVRDVMSACNIRGLDDGVQIQINDPVTIRR